MKSYIRRHPITISCIVIIFMGWLLMIIAKNFSHEVCYYLSLSRENIFSTYIPYSIFTFAFINPDFASLIMNSLFIILIGTIVEPRLGHFKTALVIVLAIILTSIIHLIIVTSPVTGIIGSKIIVSALSGSLAILLWKQWKNFVLAEKIISFIVLFRVVGILINTMQFSNHIYLYQLATFGSGAILTILRSKKVTS